jgi:TatD DNase family protein
MLVDTHCHLDAAEFAADRDALVLAAQTAGVSKIIVPAVGVENFSAVRDCCQRYDLCFPAYGIHPLYLAQSDASDLLKLQTWLTVEASTGKRPVAVGEIGLDYYVPGFDAARQYDFFIRQLKLAREFDLPVLLHVRRAVDSVLKGLRQVRVRGGIAHAFNGSRQQAEAFIALGFKLGFGGAMTYPGSTRIRQLAAALPLNSIVLETDAPDIPPHWLTGQRNVPAALMQIATVLAELRALPIAEVLQATTKNADEIFPTAA